MAKNTAACGKRDERELVKDLKARGYEARRQPGSGNVDPTLPHDVVWADSPIGKLLIECKWRTTCGWRTLLTWMEGAPILTVKCSQAGANQHKVSGDETDRYVFMKWDTFMSLVGDAAQRSEAADMITIDSKDYEDYCAKHRPDLLPPVEPDKPWTTEAERDTAIIEQAAARQLDREIQRINDRREAIQAAHQNPPQRKPKPNRLGGRGFKK